MSIEIFADSLSLATSPRAVRLILKDETNPSQVKAIVVLPPVVGQGAGSIAP